MVITPLPTPVSDLQQQGMKNVSSSLALGRREQSSGRPDSAKKSGKKPEMGSERAITLGKSECIDSDLEVRITKINPDG